MRRFIMLCLPTVVFAVVLAPAPANGFYDDVHYVFTYYLARQVGYTHKQAHRIASASVAIDWDPETEPVQAGIRTMHGAAGTQKPRWMFHAFRNSVEFDDVIGDGAADGDKADNDIRLQRTQLWLHGVADKNAGACVHFYQDELSHAKFGSKLGHVPIFGDSDEYDRHFHEGLPIGGSTDWLSYYDEETQMKLARGTANMLTRFMRKVSPHQKPCDLDEPKCRAFLRRLCDVNAVPPPLGWKSDEMKVFVRVYAKPDTLGYWSNSYDFGVKQTRDIAKHVEGTNLNAAIGVLQEAMGVRLGDHWQYNFDEDGRFASDEKKQYKIVSEIEFEVTKRDVNGNNQPYKGEVRLRMSKPPPGTTEYLLGDPKPIGTDGKVVFKEIPVGDICAEVLSEKGKLVAKEESVVEYDEIIWPIQVEGLTITRGLEEKEWYGRNVDLVVVFDTTGSMQSSIDSIRKRAIKTIRFIEEKGSVDFRLGVVSFRDQSDDPATTLKVFGFSRNIQEQIDNLIDFRADKGGDTPEDQYAGIMKAIEMWKSEQSAGSVETNRLNVVKLVVVITDAPAKYPDFQGNTPESIAAEAEAVDPAHIYPIIVGDDPDAIADGENIARLTGGKMLRAESGDDVAAALMEAIDTGVEEHGSSLMINREHVLRLLFWSGVAAISLGLGFIAFPSRPWRRK